MKTTILLASLISFFGSYMSVTAQVPSPSPRQSLTFRTLGADCAPEGINYLVGSNAIPLSIQQGIRSMPQNYSGASPMTLFRTVNGKDGKLTNVPVASVDLSQAGTYPLLVFFKGVKGPEQPIVQVLREDAKSFPGGTLRLINDSRLSVSATIASENMIIPPGNIKDYRSKDGGMFGLGISEISNSVSSLIFNSNMGVLPNKRVLFLILPAVNPVGHLEIQRHVDGVPEL